MATKHRPLTIWTNLHHNGWITNAAENADGTFAAWAAPEATVVLVADYIEDGPENARRAAEFALKQKSGREQCSSSCTGWSVYFHPD